MRKDRDELASMAIPLHAKLITVPCRSGEGLLKRLFEPLGYTIITQGAILDEKFTDEEQAVISLRVDKRPVG